MNNFCIFGDFFSTSDAIAIAAAFISICAFFATAWQAWLAWTHNRLSVRPLLVLNIDRIVSTEGVVITYAIRNCGVGPAKIKERFFMVNGEFFKTETTNHEQVRELAKFIFGDEFNLQLLQHGLPGIDSAIPQGGEFMVARLLFPNANEQLVDTIFEIVAKVSFCVRYESLYGEKNELLAD